jgi:nucleotide-binding universal stress UspA family protein
MLRQILAPLDGSPLSEQALAYAIDIIASDGKLFLLTVVDKSALPFLEYRSFTAFVDLLAFPLASLAQNPRRPGYPLSCLPEKPPPVQAIESNLISSAEVYLHRIARQVRTVSLTVEFRVEADLLPAEAIVQTASALHVDAIVMATHGRSGLSRLRLGSITHKVLNVLPCPVFVIPVKDKPNI